MMRPSLALLARAPAQPLVYARALARNLAPSFAASAVRAAGRGAVIRQEVAEAQHAAYLTALGELLGGKEKIETLSGVGARPMPDACFVEDNAVVYGDTALVCRVGHRSRRAEGSAIAASLEARGVRTVVMDDGAATIDGGDVLFTGRQFIVGLTARTNAGGADALAHAFPGVSVTTVPLGVMTARLPPGAYRPLHLKSLLSLVGPDTIAVGDSPLGHEVAHVIQERVAVPRAQRAAGRALSFLLVPDVPAANVVYANGRFLMRSAAEFPASAEVLRAYAAEAGMPVPLEVDTSELGLADGALTCCSILLH
jgi:dimethylargininase